MNKIVAMLIVATVSISIVCGLFFNQLLIVQNENSELKNELFEVATKRDELQNIIDINSDVVNITGFRVYGFNPLVCLTIGSFANISIENKGINDVTDLVLTLECTTNNESKTLEIEIIRPREKIQIKEHVMWNLGSSPTWVVTLSKNETIFDQSTTGFTP